MHVTFLLFAFVAIQSTIPTSPVYAEDASALILIDSQGCKACHTLNGEGGIIAGSFKEMRGKLTREQIRAKLVNPERTHSHEMTPDFSHLTEEDIEALVNFIQPDP